MERKYTVVAATQGGSPDHYNLELTADVTVGLSTVKSRLFVAVTRG